MPQMPPWTTCVDCHRVVWTADVDADGRCSTCQSSPTSTPGTAAIDRLDADEIEDEDEDGGSA